MIHILKMESNLKIEGDELLQRVYNGAQDLTESELGDLAYEYKKYDFIQGEDRRWSRHNQTILWIEDKYFRIGFEQGLTEYQEDMFDEQPEEVQVEVKEKVIQEKFYTKVNGK